MRNLINLVLSNRNWDTGRPLSHYVQHYERRSILAWPEQKWNELGSSCLDLGRVRENSQENSTYRGLCLCYCRATTGREGGESGGGGWVRRREERRGGRKGGRRQPLIKTWQWSDRLKAKRREIDQFSKCFPKLQLQSLIFSLGGGGGAPEATVWCSSLIHPVGF